MWKNALFTVPNCSRVLEASIYLKNATLNSSKILCSVQNFYMNKKYSQKASSQILNLLKEVERKVPSRCNITVNSLCNIALSPTDPQEYPNSDKLKVSLAGSNTFNYSQTDFDFDISEGNSNNFDINVYSKERNQDLLSSVLCTLQVPVQSNVSVVCSGNGNAQVKNMHGENISINSEKGSIETNNIRCTQINLSTKGGDIMSKGVLHGNIELSTSHDGIVECQRLQGRSVCINTEAGDIKIASTYCDDSIFQSQFGHLKLDNLHRNCTAVISQKGNLVVSGLDGSLQATLTCGDADVQLSNLQGDSLIETKQGDIKIRLSDSSKCHLKLQARKLQVPQSIQKCHTNLKVKDGDIRVQNIAYGGIKSDAYVLQAISKTGTVELLKSDWISTLNLGRKIK